MSTRAFGFHVTMRLESGHVLAPTVAERRLTARIFHEEGARRGMLAFRVADSHAHVLMVGARADAGMLARYVELRMRRRLRIPGPFAPARFRAIEDHRHLERAFEYLLRQEEHHGIELDPRHDASSGADLLRMRALDEAVTRLARAHLPRLREETVRSAMALVPCPPDYDRLADAAAAALALQDLSAPTAQAFAARAAAIHAAPDLTTGELAERLAVTRRCVERARKRPRVAALVTAVRNQLTLQPGRAAGGLGCVRSPGGLG